MLLLGEGWGRDHGEPGWERVGRIYFIFCFNRIDVLHDKHVYSFTKLLQWHRVGLMMIYLRLLKNQFMYLIAQLLPNWRTIHTAEEEKN